MNSYGSLRRLAGLMPRSINSYETNLKLEKIGKSLFVAGVACLVLLAVVVH